MRLQRIRMLCVALVIGSMAAILIATLTPNLGEVVAPGRLTSWGGHFLLFATLGTATGLAFMTTRRSRLWLVQLAILVALLAAADEMAQGWVDGRVVAFSDWIADALGGGVGIALGSSAGRYLIPRRVA